jgi:hypothetical protein
LAARCKRCDIISALEWGLNNKERKRASNKKFDKKPERKKKIAENTRRHRSSGKRGIWEDNNRDKLRLSCKIRQMTKKHEITKSEWKQCKQYFNYQCAYCGLTEIEHKKLYREQLHKDHVNPKGSNKIDNCVCACKICNCCKHTSEMEEWYRQQDFFKEDNLSKIHQWLNIMRNN